jgi:hypothetical protein
LHCGGPDRQRVGTASPRFSRSLGPRAGRIVGAARGGREEGSALGGIGRLIDGDNN